MEKMKLKSGIALIVLSTVLLVLVLISGVITYIGYDIMTTAKNTAYVRDVEIITDSIMEYYAVNGSLPVLESGKEITAEEYEQHIREIVGEEAAIKLQNEFVKNGEQDSIFYEIDISKLGIDDLKYGIKETENDVFVISNMSHVVYYYIGYENSSGLYFSNSDMIEK